MVEKQNIYIYQIYLSFSQLEFSPTCCFGNQTNWFIEKNRPKRTICSHNDLVVFNSSLEWKIINE